MRHRNGKKEKDDEIRLIYDNVPGHWKWPKKKKKKRKRDASLFLAANNPCTFLDHAESRDVFFHLKKSGLRDIRSKFLQGPTLFTPPYVQIKLVIRSIALIRPLL